MFVLCYSLLKTHSHTFFLLSTMHLFVVFSLCWHNTGWGWSVLCLLQIGHYKSSNAELWTSLRWRWQPAGPGHIQEDRAVLASSKCCLYQKAYRVSNLCSHACRNNTVLSALRMMIRSLLVWTPAVQKSQL